MQIFPDCSSCTDANRSLAPSSIVVLMQDHWWFSARAFTSAYLVAQPVGAVLSRSGISTSHSFGPGYGKTPSSVGRTAEAFADVLVSFLDLLHLDHVIVVGISAGGRTALQLAGRHPGRVSKVILQNAVTGGRFPRGLTRMVAYLLFNPLVERWTWAAFRTFGRVAPQAALRSMMGSLSSLQPNQVIATMSQDQQQAALTFLLASRSGSGFLHDMHHHCGDLSRITAPTLIIESKYDGSKDSSHATYAADHIAHAELFLSPAESHLLWFSLYDDELQAKMREFLQS